MNCFKFLTFKFKKYPIPLAKEKAFGVLSPIKEIGVRITPKSAPDNVEMYTHIIPKDLSAAVDDYMDHVEMYENHVEMYD